jgi:hypothetical protein
MSTRLSLSRKRRRGDKCAREVWKNDGWCEKRREMNLSRASWGPSASKCAKEALCLTTFLNFQKRVLSAHSLQKERKCAQSERAYTTYVYDKVRMKTQISHSHSLSRKYSIRYYKYVCISLATCFVPSLCALAEDIYARRVFSCVKESLCSEISLFLSDHLAPAT